MYVFKIRIRESERCELGAIGMEPRTATWLHRTVSQPQQCCHLDWISLWAGDCPGHCQVWSGTLALPPRCQ